MLEEEHDRWRNLLVVAKTVSLFRRLRSYWLHWLATRLRFVVQRSGYGRFASVYGFACLREPGTYPDIQHKNVVKLHSHEGGVKNLPTPGAKFTRSRTRSFSSVLLMSMNHGTGGFCNYDR